MNIKISILITGIILISFLTGCTHTKIGSSEIGKEILETPFGPPEVKEYFAMNASELPENLFFISKFIKNSSSLYLENITYVTNITGYKIYFCSNSKYREFNKELSEYAVLVNKWQMTSTYSTQKYSAYEVKNADNQAIILTLNMPNNRSCTIVQTK